MSVRESAISMVGRAARHKFASAHDADAVFFPAVLAIIWIGILGGFVPRIVAQFVEHKPPYLAIVHVHAAVFVGWLLLLTVQVGLVRSHNLPQHRRLGRLGAAWLPVMLILGLVASVIVARSKYGTPHWKPQFLAIQLADLTLFAVLTVSALLLRRDAASHKRLMLLGTVALSNAGFSRWWGPALAAWLGQGYLSKLAQDYLSDFLIVGTMLAYDIATRGRPNRALAQAAVVIVGIECLALYLYFDPGWIALTDRLLRP
jgi:uncharacterized membrane protein YozB (DUF420 family)